MGALIAPKVKNAAPGRHGDGGGLYLVVKPSGSRSWVLPIQREGKRRDLGLGTVELASRPPDQQRASDGIPILLRRQLTLSEAREKAGELRRFAKAGLDPVVERDRERRKVRMRVGQVLNFSHAKGWRPTDAPGWAVTVRLPKQPKGRNFKAIHYADVPELVAALNSKSPTAGRRAPLFLILTAARPGEVRFACWDQIDTGMRNWNRPAHHEAAGGAYRHPEQCGVGAPVGDPGKSRDQARPADLFGARG